MPAEVSTTQKLENGYGDAIEGGTVPLRFIPVRSAAQICILQSASTASETEDIRQGPYEAQTVGQVIPPEVGLCQDARKKTESHGDDSKGDEKRVDRY